MNCRLSRDYMMRYFDGEYNDIESAQLKQHLKSCTGCRAEFEEMKKVFSFLETGTEVQPPENFEADVMARLDLMESKREKSTARALIFLYNIATLVSIVLLVFFVTRTVSLDFFAGPAQEGIDVNFISTAFMYLYGLFKGIYSLITGVFRLFYQAGSILIETYYYYFVALFTVIVFIQKTLTTFIRQNRRGA